MLDILQGQQFFLVFEAYRLSLRPTQPRFEYDLNLRLTSHFNLVTGLRMRGAIHPRRLCFRGPVLKCAQGSFTLYIGRIGNVLCIANKEEAKFMAWYKVLYNVSLAETGKGHEILKA